MLLPAIVVVVADKRDDLRAVWAAMGEGPMAFTRALCAIDPEATYETPPTHFMLQDMSATDSKVAIWQAMAENQDLPPITGVWGEDGVIEAADAQAAMAPGNMQVYSAAGIDDGPLRDAWRNGVLTGAGLQFVPDEPI